MAKAEETDQQWTGNVPEQDTAIPQSDVSGYLICLSAPG